MKVAGIILAAGEARRFGGSKANLIWREKPFIQHIIDTASKAGLSPIIVVLGAHKDVITSAIQSQNVIIVENPEWSLGQGGSVSCGVARLADDVDAAIFFLVDQPQIPETLVRAMIEAYQNQPAEIIIPEVGGQRANPVLFGRKAFPELRQLKGEQGGRSLFGRYKVFMLPWLDERILHDIDTQEEYQDFLKYDQ